MIKMFADFLNTQDGIRHREARTERRQKTQEEEKCRSNGESALHVIERGEIVSLTSSLLGSYGDARVQGHDDLQLVQRRRVEQVLIRKHRKQFDSLLRSKLASVAVMDHELWSRSSNSNVIEGAIGRRHTTSSKLQQQSSPQHQFSPGSVLVGDRSRIVPLIALCVR